MRKLIPLFMVFVLVLAACGGDDDDVGSVEDADSCEDVGDWFIDEMQVLLDELSDMNAEDIAGGEPPEALTTFEANIEELGEKSEELDCSDEEMTQILEDRVDELEAEGPLAQEILAGFEESIESGELFQ